MATLSKTPTDAERDQMVLNVRALQQLDGPGVNPAQLRPFYPGVGWGTIYGSLFTLVDEGKLIRTVGHNGAVPQEYFRAPAVGEGS